MSFSYDEIAEKIGIVRLLKLAMDLEIIPVDSLSHIDLLDCYLPEAFNEIMELWYGEHPYCLDCDIDDETGEFTDYNGFYNFKFVHPAIEKFYTLVGKLYPVEYSQYEETAEKMIQSTFGCFRNNIFFNYIHKGENRDFSEIIGVLYNFDSLDLPSDFLKYLVSYIEYIESSIALLESQEAA